jgi:hypothetical protein
MLTSIFKLRNTKVQPNVNNGASVTLLPQNVIKYVLDLYHLIVDTSAGTYLDSRLVIFRTLKVRYQRIDMIID